MVLTFMYPSGAKVNEYKKQEVGLKLISDEILIDSGQQLPIHEAIERIFDRFPNIHRTGKQTIAPNPLVGDNLPISAIFS
jgi:hypothetical protein